MPDNDTKPYKARRRSLPLPPLAPPLPPTSTIYQHLPALSRLSQSLFNHLSSPLTHPRSRTFSLSSCLKLYLQQCRLFRPPGPPKGICERTWLPKRLKNRAQKHPKISFRRLRAEKADLAETSVFTVSNTHLAFPGFNILP